MKAIYRIEQFFMCTALHILGQKEPERFVGDGCLLKLPEILKRDGHKKIILITTEGFIRRGTLSALLDGLKTADIDVALFTQVKPDPLITTVEDAVLMYKKEQCSAIVAIGGGSAIDTAKATGARIAKPGKTIPQMRGNLKVMRRLPDIYAVPTTAGTGSEATCAAVVTEIVDGTHYKYSINDPVLIPKTVFLDPALLLTLPDHITADTGMDALTHAVEGYTNRFPEKKAKGDALTAVKMIFQYLPGCYANGKDEALREKMLLASYYAGVAFTNNFVGYVHAVGHAVGALYGLPHGKACAIILPHVMAQFGESAQKDLAELAEAVGIEGESEKEKAEGFIKAIREMNRSMGIPAGVPELKGEDYDTIISRAMKEANPTYPVPDIWGREEFTVLLNTLKSAEYK